VVCCGYSIYPLTKVRKVMGVKGSVMVLRHLSTA